MTQAVPWEWDKHTICSSQPVCGAQVKAASMHADKKLCPHSQDLLSSLWYISAGSLEVLDGPLVIAILGRGDLVGG